ncbi:hypothetical protein GGH99_002921, partial [Coemansia sp. RSA 1285]
MHSGDAVQRIPQMEHSSRTRSDSSTISNFISSLRLERTNTKANGQNPVQRRKTLNKQAKDPMADQAALEKEIRHIERLASLLGRRPTKFDLKRNKPTVNHDLDDTLVGFFDVNEDDERLGEMLLSGRHTATAADFDEEQDMSLEAPELKAQNIHAAPAALIADQQSTVEYANDDDPFDKIEEMNIKASPSGSAEYLPIDNYKDSEGTIRSGVTESQQQVSSGLQKLRVEPNSMGGNSDDSELDSPTCNDDILADINRSNTWKRQSNMLIQERERFGLALPKIADISDEDDELHDDIYSNNAKNEPPPNNQTAPDDGGQPGPAGPALTEPTSKTGLLSTALAVEEYLDILDYMDEKNQNEDSQSDCSSNDGHISSDLQGNSDSSDGDDILLSEGGDGSSDSDSDASGSRYLARLTPQQPRDVSSGVEADNVQYSAQSLHIDGFNSVEPDGASGSQSARQNRHIRVAVTMPLSAGSRISGVPGRPTLRRSRRVLSKGRSLKSSSGLAATLAQRPPALQTAKSEFKTTQSRLESAGDHDERSFVKEIGSDLGQPQIHSPDNKQRSDIASSTVVQTQLPGLARLAEDAVATSKETSSSTQMKKQQPHASTHKPLPPIPDRILRTLDAAGASSSEPGSGRTASAPVKIPPPLPDKARPTVSRTFGGERLGTRAELEAESERPSSRRLFDDDRGQKETSGQAYDSILSMSSPTLPMSADGIGSSSSSAHRPGTPQSVVDETSLKRTSSPLAEWLQRTDIMLPTNNPSTVKVPLYPPGGSGKPITFNSYHYEPPADEAQAHAGDNPRSGSRRMAKGRVVRRVSVLPPPQTPSAYQHAASPGSSLYSFASQTHISPVHSIPNSPLASKRTSTVSAPTPTRADSSASSTTHSTRPQQSEAPHDLPNSAHPASPSMENPASSAHAKHIASSSAYAFSSMDVSGGPTVLSAPPGASEMISDAEASAPVGMLEPSAPMLPEPTAPELPQQWAASAPQAYAFPLPVHYVTSPTQGGYGLSPQLSNAWLSARTHGRRLALPPKPRPQSVPSASLPSPPQPVSCGIASSGVSAEDVSAPADPSRTSISSALLSPTGGFVM